MEERVFNILPDAPDLRDRIYNPTLRSLEPSYNSQPYKDPIWRERVKEQGSTQACTGFALSSMVESLADQSWRKRNGQEAAPDMISPFMLYYMARHYDEIPGDDVNGGSTARAAMKAWHKHGACRQEFWNDIDTKPETAHPEWVADAFKTPLGAYYRVDHRSIPDLHAAINEVGVVYATGVIHHGWSNPTEGDIPFQVSSLEIGGHAFLLVGYDEKGFQSGKVAAYTQFHLADAIEKNDNCLRLYNKSLLYLVSNAFERKRGRPILGMEKFVNQAQLTQKPTNAKVEVWDWIASPTLPIPPEAANSSTSTTHGGFDSDTETMRAILTRICDRQK